MKKNTFAVLVTILLSVLFSNSCKKPEVDTETQSATDNSICEAEFTAIMPATNSKAIGSKGISGNKLSMPAGPYIWVDSTINTNYGWPRRLVIDYDKVDEYTPAPDGFTDTDGRKRKGYLSMLVDGGWDTSKTARITIDTINNYTVNGINYDAYKIIIQKNTNLVSGNNTTSFTTTVIDGTCYNSSWNLTWSGTRTFTLNNGDVSVTGNATGTNRVGLAYSTNITSPIVKNASCAYISSGVIEITPAGKVTRTIDYSVNASGTSNVNACDNFAALTIKGTKFIFKLD